MGRQVGRLRECLEADVTFEWTFVGVSSQVSFER